jgi:hypothetical protein
MIRPYQKVWVLALTAVSTDGQIMPHTLFGLLAHKLGSCHAAAIQGDNDRCNRLTFGGDEKARQRSGALCESRFQDGNPSQPSPRSGINT